MPKMKFREWYKYRYGHEYEEERVAEIGGAMARIFDGLAEWADLVADGAIPESKLPPPPQSE